MGMNRETHTNVSVVMRKEVFEKLKEIAEREKRSISKQALKWIEEKLEEDKNKVTPAPVDLFLPEK